MRLLCLNPELRRTGLEDRRNECADDGSDEQGTKYCQSADLHADGIAFSDPGIEHQGRTSGGNDHDQSDGIESGRPTHEEPEHDRAGGGPLQCFHPKTSIDFSEAAILPQKGLFVKVEAGTIGIDFARRGDEDARIPLGGIVHPAQCKEHLT